MGDEAFDEAKRRDIPVLLICLPDVDERALEGHKSREALPERLAEATLAQRMADLEGAAAVLGESARFVVTHG